VTDTVLALPAGTRFYVTFPLALSGEVTHEVVVENLRAQGFVRVSVDGVIKHFDDLLTEAIDVTFAKELLVVVDRLVVGDDARGRLADAVGTAFREGDGDALILFAAPVSTPLVAAPTTRLRFTERFECANDGTRAPTPTPQ